MFKPVGFSEEIFKLRYAFTENETWVEACKRVSHQMAIAETPDKVKKYEDMFNEILVDNLFVPGGRIWYNSGRPNPNLLNCVEGNTLIHIRGGTALAKDLVGKEVDVLSEGGIYRRASWASYGQQVLLKVTLANGDVLYATPDHEWVVAHRGHTSTVKTKNLEGYKIPFCHPKQVIMSDLDFKTGVQHGLVFGDGSLRLRKIKENYTEVRQFGEVNTKLILNYFDEEQIRFYNDKNYGKVYYATRLPGHFKQLPTGEETQSYLRGFLAGFIATDGHVAADGVTAVFQSNLEHLTRVRELASKAGIPSLGIKMYRQKCPFTDKYAPNYKLSFYKSAFKDNPELIIKESHKKNLLNSKDYNKTKWIDVTKVEYTTRFEEVFCCVEPETHTMVIGNGYLTKQCFVLENQLDSREGWARISHDMIMTSMCGGGAGIDFSDVRPSGAEIKGQRGFCPGPLSLMKLINSNGFPVRAGGERRVALMFSLDSTHPDIEAFIDSKLVNGDLQLANISVRFMRTRDFIDTVKNDGDWELSWKGKYKAKIKARTLWHKILQNTYNSAEPGFLNWELVQEESTISYIRPLITTNPCGELPLAANESCCLGHLVLPRYISGDDLDWEVLGNTIRVAVRFLDNVLSINHYPLPDMKTVAQDLRRIGLGTIGLADTLILLGIKYGSEESYKFIDKLYRFISKQAYEASIILAVEKGPFPSCKPDLHVKTGFVSRMTPKIKNLIKEHGIRNCGLLTQAPGGTISILSGNVSSGIEPIFAPAYERRYWVGDERKVEVVFHPLFELFHKENKDLSNFVSARELTIRQHMEVQKLIQRHLDASISKTINVAEDCSIEEMGNIWLEYLPFLKGTTFYRENTRGFIDDKGVSHEPPLVALSIKKALDLISEKGDNTNWELTDCKDGYCNI